ncbi:MAG: hypothetical protein A3J59_05000 [Candidatus Buchananbacteria bacterium RIFCSPHIGHO2_02_FULL_56_16]|uniref:Uncharacterized protein n=1 Tax=Candidatus Buchananbacteria bacterium RIFCSPHIGHO2_02_FULL_56_16 TaxID=1797542 RepID=A0A1G1YHB5_9BACT|nr:MAG: hypothetical protein A3J59_05000 [Candidatus Buchananbacteria bacterium RIFCSPHIGHO2_02_FULL_56_16]
MARFPKMNHVAAFKKQHLKVRRAKLQSLMILISVQRKDGKINMEAVKMYIVVKGWSFIFYRVITAQQFKQFIPNHKASLDPPAANRHYAEKLGQFFVIRENDGLFSKNFLVDKPLGVRYIEHIDL